VALPVHINTEELSKRLDIPEAKDASQIISAKLIKTVDLQDLSEPTKRLIPSRGRDINDKSLTAAQIIADQISKEISSNVEKILHFDNKPLSLYNLIVVAEARRINIWQDFFTDFKRRPEPEQDLFRQDLDGC